MAGAVPLLPQTVADQDDIRSAGTILIHRNIPSDYRGHAEQRKEVGGYRAGLHLFRLAVAGDGVEIAAERCHVAENVVAGFPVDEIPGRGCVARPADLGSVFPN